MGRDVRIERRLGLALSALLVLGIVAQPAVAKKKASYAKDLEAFVKEVDKSYPFFDLKKIRKDWKKAKKDLKKRVRKCKTDDEFIALVFDAVKVLRDGHIQVRPRSGTYPAWPKRFYPGLGLMPASEGRVVVMHPPPGRDATLPKGTVITKIDGKPARTVLEDRARASWEEGGFFSSPQRARIFAYRTPLEGERGEKHVFTYRDGEREKTVKLRSEHEIRSWPRAYNLPDGLRQEGKSFYYTKLESGVGYMWWRRIDESIWQAIPKALEAHPDATGWIVDLRANSGGGYGSELLDGMKRLQQPVAAIVDAGCVSAGETAARDLVNLAKARLFGSTTAGSSSSKRMWEFPSGIASVRFSTRSRGGLGKGIEFNGIDPHVPVECDPEDVAAGRNTEILAAEAWVLDGGNGGKGR